MTGKDKFNGELIEYSAKKPPKNTRYEYRVWGKHPKASGKLARQASSEIREEIQDWYLLVDDPEWNAKVRGSALKLKHLESNKKGFERWSTDWHREATDIPTPFDSVFEDSSIDRVTSDKRYELADVLASLDDDERAAVVLVTKRRRRFRIGSMKAEVTKIEVEGGSGRLHTVAIQGDNLKELIALLRFVGLDDLPNVPMHVMIGKVLN